MPAVNVTSSSTVVATLEAARDSKSPVVLQFSQGGAAFFAGKGVTNSAEKQEASVAGAVAAAHYIRAIAPIYGVPVVLHTDHCAKKLLPWLDGMLDADEAEFKKSGTPLFSSHMIDLSEEEVKWNIDTTAAYLKRSAPMKLWLEMEIGITGGEEDGVNNEDVDNNSLYTQPEDIWAIYETLSAISYGVVKVNLDTDLQWAYLTGVRDYVTKNIDYLKTQVGNPEGADKPNKKKYDPRVWVRESEKTMTVRVKEALDHFKAAGSFPRDCLARAQSNLPNDNILSHC
ncbi:Fructose-bisphosphate aldolase like protein [Verticillium longisporum]|nr:Fructose-bisphosphate aldolase like protein [Verticillium longisporum]